MTSGRQVTPRNLERRISRLKTLSSGIEKGHLNLSKQVPLDIEIKS